ncbi:hypothetical protein SARC_08756 [Sphaeroforma arctica JP610]|uniref:Uncharacterized protein n=1 Tax=Sphaeroforma arctica JP610 TaxID=667725 RepID=A0A0L0FQK5_9EUKA|nr:hypothetical protein SARC_08756 [Sphaeroforma arctica JP610]KNC78821.1 hypothetical protein SARC_08756 [Sphaeroforma arctica JP610]|eukprot:XP_014152723.1 hypothetical protein SARC_08756 [Sphaeroforma arctica JP610]
MIDVAEVSHQYVGDANSKSTIVAVDTLERNCFEEEGVNEIQLSCAAEHEGCRCGSDKPTIPHCEPSEKKRLRLITKMIQKIQSRFTGTNPSCRKWPTGDYSRRTSKSWTPTNGSRISGSSKMDLENDLKSHHCDSKYATMKGESRKYKIKSKGFVSTSNDSLACLQQLIDTFEKTIVKGNATSQASSPETPADVTKKVGESMSFLSPDNYSGNDKSERDLVDDVIAQCEPREDGHGKMCVSSMLRRQSSRMASECSTVYEGVTSSAASFTSLNKNLREHSKRLQVENSHSVKSMSMSSNTLRSKSTASTLRLQAAVRNQEMDLSSSHLLTKLQRALKSGAGQNLDGEFTQIDFGSTFSSGPSTSCREVPVHTTKPDNFLSNATRRIPLLSTKSDNSLTNANSSAHRSGGLQRSRTAALLERTTGTHNVDMNARTDDQNDTNIIARITLESDRDSDVCVSYESSGSDSGVASSMSSAEAHVVPDIDFSHLLKRHKKSFQTIDWGDSLGSNGALNIALLGARKTGKSTLVHRLQHGLFNAVYEPTVSDLSVYDLSVAGNSCHVNILDSSAEAWTCANDVHFGSGVPTRGVLRKPRFGRSQSQSSADLMRGKSLALHGAKASTIKTDIPHTLDPLWWAHGYILTFSVVDQKSFDHVIALKEELVDRRRRFMQSYYVPVPITVVGTKVDKYTTATQGLYNSTKDLPSWVAEAQRLVSIDWGLEFRLVTCTQNQCTGVFFTLGRKMRDYYLRKLLRDELRYTPNYTDKVFEPLVMTNQPASLNSSPTNSSIGTM